MATGKAATAPLNPDRPTLSNDVSVEFSSSTALLQAVLDRPR
jgi:hypothetical protein